MEIVSSRWRAADGDFAILGAQTADGDDVTIKGALGHVQVGESVTVGGAWKHHARHGWQFHADRVVIAEPVGDAALLAYLSSIKHVGIRGAAWLLDKHGDEVLAVIDGDPERRLRQVPGIGPAKLGAAVRSWEGQGALRAVRLFLEQHGVPASVAARIYRTLGNEAIGLLQADPYALTQVDGIGFATADALAQALGVGADSPGRLDAGVVHTLELAETNGHCHLPREELLGRAYRLLDADVADRLAYLAASGRVMLEEERVSEASMHATERASGAPGPRAAAGRAGAEGQGGRASDGRGLRPHGCAVGGGRPGPGRAPVDPHRRAWHRQDGVDGDRGGRAACPGERPPACARRPARRRVGCAETTGADATTIHRLLEWVPGEGFTRDREQPDRGRRRPHRRRGLDALRAPGAGAARRRRARVRTSCSSGTWTSWRPWAPAGSWRI